MKYRKEIDGLRALAIIPVILSHAGYEIFSGGFVGVDVFFVISGYLITTIIITALDNDRFSLAEFYERRARRILPALFLVTAICIPFAWLLLLPDDFHSFAKSVFAVATFSSNFLFWSESGYFEAAAELKPLLHTWSLAVEEQYYIIFPLLLLVLWRTGRAATIIVLIATTIASFAYAAWATSTSPATAFYLLPARAWELLVGGLAAFYLYTAKPAGSPPGHCEFFSILGVALILYAVLTYDSTTPFPGHYAMAPVTGTFLVIVFARESTLVGRLLSSSLLVGVGIVSYSAYLWHQPLFAFARHKSLIEPSALVFSALIAITFSLAFLSWRYVEQPFRRNLAISRKTVFLASGFGTGTFVALGLAIHLNMETVERHWLSSMESTDQSFYMAVMTMRDTENRRYGLNHNRRQELSECRFNVRSLNASTLERLQRCSNQYGPGVLVTGDSHAIDLWGMLASRFDTDFLVGITRAGCRPHTPEPGCYYDRLLAALTGNPDWFDHIIYEQAGFYLLLDQNGRKGGREMFEKLGYGEAVVGLTPDHEHISGTLEYLEKLAQSTPVTWFLPRIEPHISRNLILHRGCRFPYQLRANLRETFGELEDAVRLASTLRGGSDVRLVSQNAILRYELPEDFLNCDSIFWADGDHLSTSGQIRFGKRLPDDFLFFE